MTKPKKLSYLIGYTIFLCCFACTSETDTPTVPTKVDIAANHVTWEHYLGDPERSHYSDLSQIDTKNVNQLKIAWTYQSGGMKEGRNSQIQANPLIVGEKLLSVNATNHLFAINNKTGKKIWDFVPNSQDQSGLGLSRGLTFWRASDSKSKVVFFMLLALNYML